MGRKPRFRAPPRVPTRCRCRTYTPGLANTIFRGKGQPEQTAIFAEIVFPTMPLRAGHAGGEELVSQGLTFILLREWRVTDRCSRRCRAAGGVRGPYVLQGEKDPWLSPAGAATPAVSLNHNNAAFRSHVIRRPQSTGLRRTKVESPPVQSR